ncbi:MAG TPA: stage III sporulation protein AH [Lachnospiraceae bacterium]|nr:stage III sporulation protein AH [Lachnospiraceae bacterium]
MKKIVKKNQIIITTLALLIAAAGYLNYSGKLFPNKTTTEANSDLANQELLDISEEDALSSQTDILSQDTEIDGTPGEAVLTSTEAGIASEAKLAREQVRAQNRETLNAIIDNTNISEEQKQEAVNQLVKLTELAEKEVAAETLLASKGFENVVVSLTDASADIVVGGIELTEANRAQIMDIVSRKTEIAPENIVINPIRSSKDAQSSGQEGEENKEESADTEAQ